jgi:Icc-related predicted phosphoesterase
MKAFWRHAQDAADALEHSLRDVADAQVDVRIALTHYSPVEDTLRGERLEIYPFLGSYLLAEAIDRVGADLAIHGHAHAGSERGVTPGGVPVRNVAQPVLRRAYTLFCLQPGEDDDLSCEAAGATTLSHR